MKTQAWRWLVAGVVAAGLNASFHQGGLRWAHQIAQDVEHNSAAVIALASGRADEFLAQARLLTISVPKDPCAAEEPVGVEVAELAKAEPGFDLPAHFTNIQPVKEYQSERVQAEVRQEMTRAHLEVLRARLQAQMAEQSSHFRDASASFDQGVLRRISSEFSQIKFPECSRVRVSFPKVPAVKIPAVRVDAVTAGPV